MGNNIIIDRERLENFFISDKNSFQLFFYLLINSDVEKAGIERGKLCITIRQLSANLNQTIKEIRGALNRLEKANFIKITRAQARAQLTPIITICNYENYIGCENTQGHTQGHKKKNEGTTKGTTKGTTTPYVINLNTDNCKDEKNERAQPRAQEPEIEERNEERKEEKKKSNIKENKEEKKEEKKEKPIEEREKIFKEKVMDFACYYSPKMIQEFLSYWTEPTLGKRRMRFEQQKTWDFKRRLRYWHDRSAEFQQRKTYKRKSCDISELVDMDFGQN